MTWIITRIFTIVAVLIGPSQAFPKLPPNQKTTLAGFQPYHLRPHEAKTVLPKCPEDDPLCELTPPPEPPSMAPKYLLPGLVMGVPLNLLSWVFIHDYYGTGAALTPQLIALNCLVGAYTYGMDRMMDAVEWGRTGAPQEAKKAPLYQYILENYDILKNIYDSTYWMFAMILMSTPEDGIRAQTLVFLVALEAIKFSANLRYTFFSYYLGIHGYRLWAIYGGLVAAMAATHWFDHEFMYLPMLAALDTARYYPVLKKRWGWLKAPYVGAMWTGAIAVMPSLLWDHSYDVLRNSAVLVPFLGMTALSNLADIKDIEEDKANSIQTIPVLLGGPAATLVSMKWLVVAFYVWQNHPVIF